MHLSPLAATCFLALAASTSAQCLGIGAFSSKGTLPTNLLPTGTATQISGMVASRHNPGVLWIHDDGDVGHNPQVLALRPNGSLAQQYLLSGVTDRDWEDIAIGPGPVAGRDYLYLAEIGNNQLANTAFTLLRFAEPDVPASPGTVLTLTPEVFRWHYPSGTFNAETLWIDPADGAPYVLTKESNSTPSLFRYPLPLDSLADKALVLERKLQGLATLFTGGAVSADGRVILARTTSGIYSWSRPAGTAFANAFSVAPCALANSQGQAEAISFSADGKSLWALSEGSAATLWNAPLTYPTGAPVAFAFGSGLAGSAGIPGLGALGAPRLGGPPLAVAAWQVAPSAAAFALLSGIGFPDGAVAFAGGWLHAAPDVVLPLPISAAGTATLALGAVPDAALLYGLSVWMQVLAADATAPSGVALSAGLRLVLDR